MSAVTIRSATVVGVEAPVTEIVSETITLDTSNYDPGIYQAYVTVKDYVSGSISTRSVRFAVTR